MNSKDIGRVPYRESSRLTDWDYSNPGWYFVTICTKEGQPFFGQIQNGIVGLSTIGCLVHYVWQNIPRHFDSTSTDMFIVMPNHVHGIIRILDVGKNTGDFNKADAINCVPTEEVYDSGGVTGQENPMSDKRHLGKIVRWFKGRCSYEIHKRGEWEFGWQSRYYDRIIRDAHELDRIRGYIRDNPIHWKDDDYYFAN